MRALSNLSLSVAALTLLFVPDVQPATIVSQTFSGSYPATITGTLANQDTVLEEAFSLTSLSNLTILTTSYAAGGFEPNITLYDSSGGFIASSAPPGSNPAAKADPHTGLALDTELTQSNVKPGSYTVALTDWELSQSPTATNLSDGFTSNLGSGTTFVDVMGNTRSGNFALVINPTSTTTATPELSTFWLGTALLVPALLTRKRLRSMQSKVRSFTFLEG